MSDNFVLYSGWAFGLVGLVGTVIGIYYAINAHQRHPLKALELRKKASELMLFPSNMDAYKFKLNGGDVAGRLTRTKLLLKNIGNTGIELSDLRPGTKATIDFEIKDGTLLGLYVTAEGDDKTRAKLTLEQEGNTAKLSWDYFDPQDEFNIVAYDTGAARVIKLKGDFKSGVVISNGEPKGEGKLRSAGSVAFVIATILLYAGLVGFAAILLIDVPLFHFALFGPLRQKFYVGMAASLLVLLVCTGLIFLAEKLVKSTRKYAAKIKSKFS